MMNIISSIVNSGYVMDSVVGKDTSVRKGLFQNALQEETTKIKKVTEASRVNPHARDEGKYEEGYKPIEKKITSDDSTRIMAVMRNTGIINQIRVDIAADKEKIINLVKVRNAYHIQER